MADNLISTEAVSKPRFFSTQIAWIVLAIMGVVATYFIADMTAMEAAILFGIAIFPALITCFTATIMPKNIAQSLILTVWLALSVFAVSATGGVKSALIVYFPLLALTVFAFLRGRGGIEAMVFAAMGFLLSAATYTYLSGQNYPLPDSDDLTILIWAGLALIQCIILVRFLKITAMQSDQHAPLIASSTPQAVLKTDCPDHEDRDVNGAATTHISDSAPCKHDEDEVITQKDKTKSNHYMAEVNHELRNGLNGVLGFSEIMAKETYGPLGEKYKEAAAQIQTGSLYLKMLIDDLLDISKIDAGKYDLSFHTIDLRKAVAEAIGLTGPGAVDRNITIQVIGNKTPIMIEADRRVIVQILLNLLDNALKYSPDGSIVKIELSESVDQIHIAISDQGRGIEEGKLQTIMEPYTQAEDSVAGTGLGLSIVKAFIQLHKGEFELKNGGDAGGLQAKITLPRKHALHAS